MPIGSCVPASRLAELMQHLRLPLSGAMEDECALVRTWPPALGARGERWQNATTGADCAKLVRPLKLPFLRRLPARCNRRSLGCGSGLAGLDRLRAACGVRSRRRLVFEHPAACRLRDLRNVTAADGQPRCGGLRD